MGYRFLFATVFILYELCGYLSNDMFIPAVLAMSDDFNVALDLVQLSIGAWLIGNGIAQLFLGPFCDRFGRKYILLWGGGIYAFTLIGCSLSLNINEFLFFRLLQGMSVASLMVAGYAAIHENYGEREAATILGLTGSVVFFAPMLGPLIGALILEAFSWRAIFAALCTPTVALLIILAFIMPQKHRPMRRQSLKQSFNDYIRLLTERNYVLFTLAYGCQLGCLMLWITSSPYLLMKTGGLSEQLFSLCQVPIFAVLAVGAGISRIMIKKWPLWHIAICGQALMAAGAFLFLLIALLDGPWEFLVVALLPLSFGYGFMSSPLVRSTIKASQLDLALIIAGFFLCIDLIAGSASLLIAGLADTSTKLALCLLSLSSAGLIFSIATRRTDVFAPK